MNKYISAFNRMRKAIKPICEKYECTYFRLYLDALCSYLRYGVTPNQQDVAVLENGFEMVEGNYDGDSGFMQSPSQEGKKKIIFNVIKQISKK